LLSLVGVLGALAEAGAAGVLVVSVFAGAEAEDSFCAADL
jgi:hypothetical protein